MTAKQWLRAFLGTAVLLAVLLALFNVLTDPFGVFGDPLFSWWSYNETNNPRAAKTVWLQDHWDDYDAYLIGCSSTSSFPVETLNRQTGRSFYNLIMYGADMLDCEQTVRWLLENDDVREIWLNVYIDNGAEYDTEPNAYTHAMHPDVDGSNPVPFYARYLFLHPAYGAAKIKNFRNDTWLAQPFDVFDAPTGAYDKRRRDVEPISDLPAYLEAYPVFSDYPPGEGRTLPETEACMDSVRRIAALCEEAGVKLTVLTAPVYAEYYEQFDEAERQHFYEALADVTEYWDFSYSSVSFEPRYFYDSTHFRNAVGDMALARIFGEEIYIPADFGQYVTAETAKNRPDTAEPLPDEALSASLPVLMYHHLAAEENDVTVSPERFRSHMQALTAAGYTTVSLEEMYAYVMDGGTLPDKPVLVTFDDGYASNAELAFPILEEYGMKAVIFPIGVSFGKDTYKDTGHPMFPHFGAEAVQRMLDSGLVEVQSHTYDLHQSEALEDGTHPVRPNVDRLPGESEEDYLRMLRDDAQREAELLRESGVDDVFALAYPCGVWTEEAAAVFRESGIRMTFSTAEKVHTLVRGLEQSLYAVHRFNIGGDLDAEALLGRIGCP